MNRRKIYLKYSWLILLFIAVIACEPSRDTYIDYLKNNDKINSSVGAPISVSSKSGKNRIIFDLVIPADPRISNGKVEWLEGGVLKDAEFKISRTTTKIDTVEIDITEIAGGIFSFDFFLQDTKGNKSAKLSKTATVYDDEYGSLLIPRRISKLKSYATNNPEIDSVLLIWATPLKQVVNSTLKYTDNNSVLRTLAIDNSVDTTILVGYDRAVPVSITSVILPEEGALDQFKTSPIQFEIPRVSAPMDHTQFVFVEGLFNDYPKIPPRDAAANNWNWTNIWDGNLKTNGIALLNKAPEEGIVTNPCHITIDLGKEVELTQFECWGYSAFTKIGLREYEIWGTNTLTNAETQSLIAEDYDAWAEESSEKGWTLLLKDNRTSANDKKYFKQKIESSTRVRYIRLVMFKSYYLPLEGITDIGIAEIRLSAYKD